MSTSNHVDFQKIISPKFTKDTLFEIIRKETGFNEINIDSIKFGENSAKGDSYLSDISRFVVSGTGKSSRNGQQGKFNIPIIVKMLLRNLARRKTFRGPDFFENEIIFYEKVWAAFDAFQNSKNISNKIQPVPKLLSACHDGVNDYIAFEDLSFKRYRNASRGNGLNFDQIVEILKVFARFHGLGLAFKDQQPKKFEEVVGSLKETYFAEKFRSWYQNFQDLIFEIYRDALAKELPPVYLEKFNKLISSDFYGKLCELCNIRGPLSVATQGDSWIPNFLFQYSPDNNQSVTDIIMIDFQLARYTSLSTDITFFLYTCTDPAVLEKHFEDFIVEYHKSLSETISGYGSSPDLVTLEDLRADIIKNIPFGIGMSIEAVTFSLIDDDLFDLDKLQGDEAFPLHTVWTVKPFKEQEKRKRIVSFIKHAVDNNFI